MSERDDTAIPEADDEMAGFIARHILAGGRASARSPAMKEAARRYDSDPAFRSRADAVLRGIGLRVVGCSVLHGGIVGGAAPGSPFAGKIGDFADGRLTEATRAEQKFVLGAVLVAIAAAAFPASSSALAQGDVFSVQDVVSLVNRAAAEARGEEDDGEGPHLPTPGEIVAQVLDRIPNADDSKRRSTRSLAAIAEGAIEKMAEMGYLAPMPKDADGLQTWRPLWTFREVVADAGDRTLVATLRRISALPQAQTED